MVFRRVSDRMSLEAENRELSRAWFHQTRDEAIMIGDGIAARVLRVGRDGVRLGTVAALKSVFIAGRLTIRSAQPITRRLLHSHAAFQ